MREGPIRCRPLYGNGIMYWHARLLCDGVSWRWDGLDADERNVCMVDDTETLEHFLSSRAGMSVHPDHYASRHDFAALIDWGDALANVRVMR